MLNRKMIVHSKSVVALSMIMLAMTIISLISCSSSSDNPPSVVFKFAVTDDSRAAGGGAIVPGFSTGFGKSNLAQNNGVSTVVMAAIANDVATQGVDFVLFPGDMITGEINDSTQIGSEFDTWKAIIAPIYNLPIFAFTTRGNHEYNPGAKGANNSLDPSRAAYLAHFAMPNNGPADEAGLTYSFLWKGVKIIGFDQYANRTAAFDNTLYAPGSNKGQMMNSWVINEVNNSTAVLNFVMAHEQIWPSMSHPDCMANDPDSRDALVHALGTHNGTYLAGHDHMYVRGAISNASGDKVPALVVGTGGAGNYDFAPFDVVSAGYTGPAKYNVQKSLSSSANPVFGYLLVTVYSDNTWKGEFHGFNFNKWNNATDVSLTPIRIMDAFNSTEVR